MGKAPSIQMGEEHPKRTWQPIDTLYSYRELRSMLKDAGFVVQQTAAAQSLPPFLSAAPVIGRIYRRFNLDRLFSKLLPDRLGYRVLFIATVPPEGISA